MLKAVIFDMDGLLVDTEPLWRDAEMKIFSGVGVNLTEEMTASTMGLKIDEVVEHWHKLYPWDESTIPKQKIVNNVLDELEKLIDEKGRVMKGVEYIIDFFRHTPLKMALASSSSTRLIKFILNRFNFHNIFEVIHSGENEKLGKPDPAIYLHTAELLNIRPEECLALEDSYNGLLSAKRAGMKTVAVPDPMFKEDKRFDIADIRLNSLNEFNEECWNNINEL